MFGFIGRLIGSPLTTIGGVVVSVLAFAIDQGPAFTWHGLINVLPAILGAVAKDK